MGDDLASQGYTMSPNGRWHLVITAGEAFEVKVSLGKEIAHPNTTEHHIAWISLFFNPEGDNFLQLSNATGEAMSDLVVVFDAARWSYLGPLSNGGD